jgi:hypothetical protein
MKRVFVLEPRRYAAWCATLISALRERGVDVELTDAIACLSASQGVTCVDLRSAAERARLPATGLRVLHMEIGGERSGIPAFEEARNGAQTVDVRLVAGEPGKAQRVVRFGRFPYASRHARTLDRIAGQCATWIERELEAPSPLERYALAPVSSAAKAGLSDRALFALRELFRFTAHAFRYLFEEACWDVAVTRGAVHDFIEDPQSGWLHWFARNRWEFLADPFPVCSEPSKPRLLCETHRGEETTIVAIDLDERFGSREPLLNASGRSSYPFVLEVDGEPWVIPEQHHNARIDAYHLNGKATLVASWQLDEIAPVDATIVEHEGRWWLFCTNEAEGPNYALYVYWSEHPQGPWHAHARNPVKIDVTGARPAGNFFVHDNSLYRPAQDCSGRYGRALSIQRIDVLTPREFEETRVARIDPSMLQRKGAVGIHTLSHGYGWVAVDAQFVRWSTRKALRILKRYFK